ncbi:potassium-transporting ATPase subunit C [Streptomyces asiaticus]|uniref:Potassium-transporting ATPase KdpC subunit n=1 Tax=Streptomyces rhizosphaericus TaxID=114699 RepID=A0ABN1PIQ8_9ACTN
MPSRLSPVVRNHLSALRMLLVFTVLAGIIYPLAVTGVAQAAFSDQANGSRVERHGETVGSSLLGQNFNLPERNPEDPDEVPRPHPKWFQPRPSAGGYDPLVSGASNLGPNDKSLVKTVKERRAAIAEFDGVDPKDVPADAVTASGSGLDPHISKRYAYEQVNRVAKARGLTAASVRELVADHVQGRVIVFLGAERVNVVELNAALDEGRRTHRGTRAADPLPAHLSRRPAPQTGGPDGITAFGSVHSRRPRTRRRRSVAARAGRRSRPPAA